MTTKKRKCEKWRKNEDKTDNVLDIIIVDNIRLFHV